MYDFHKDKSAYHQIQYQNASHSLLPFIRQWIDLPEGSRVMEIGSAEGGNLKAFADTGFMCTGIEMSHGRIELAKSFCRDEVNNGSIRFIHTDIFDVPVPVDEDQKYDLIFLKDVLEHLHDQERFMLFIHHLLKNDGYMFLGFPSWYMPFGGHQQMCRNRWLARTPFFHLLPMPVYKKILSWFNKHDRQNPKLIEIKETGISIQRFEQILKKGNYDRVHRQFYLIPPIYKFKFGLKERKLSPLVGSLPLLREFFISSAYYLIRHRNPEGQ